MCIYIYIYIYIYMYISEIAEVKLCCPAALPTRSRTPHVASQAESSYGVTAASHVPFRLVYTSGFVRVILAQGPG